MTPTHLPGRVAISEQTRGTTPGTRSPLEHFNTAPAADAVHTLLTCLHSHHWAHRITDHRPYPTLDALLAASDEAAYDLTPEDLTEALTEESLPVLPEGAYSAARMALSAAQAAYETRFGHTFVICLDDLPPSEALDRVLEAIRSRLTNDPEEERIVTAEELRRLARGRLVEAFRGAGL
ncbi:2-oxo-4-hydroxy-4-carboxy-5-ureidoimidazoline decarboxylase [Streptomyces sp. NL15-2K]|uniref:2-oxo-4-hydroxy-4-carboxy-5-ureidoimidazoline decarboxylase n=1 Tax=Streptomyces sp. NL15-2K TaxID=376149 RepID=UPI000F5827BC|nr:MULTISPECIES: 2-oxo-4-hydroxy-4-carboxy-5-ureidoimidazoline decarboxylase [Actinomycetes]WKX11979.1 2-oxo-4-hydroxy-4-carboxy-5-ureidoimidazoline decarboxylase [Kutzneria buriramensis]GCB46541.1 uricase [Streptomyces sp. NL15-2K]